MADPVTTTATTPTSSTSGTTTTTASSNPNTPSTPPMTMEQFASGIKSRIPALKDIPDDVLTKRALETHPDLGQHVTIGEPRRPVKRDRTPTFDQQSQKFFENHPVTREVIIKGLGGIGAPESQHVWRDFGKGIWNTITDPPKTKDEYAFAFGLPAYRLAKGMVQQTYGYGQDAFDSVDWDATAKKLKEGGHGKHDTVLTLKEGSGGAPQLAGAAAGLAAMIVSVLAGGKKAPAAGDAVVHAGQTIADTATAAKSAVHGGVTEGVQSMAGTGANLADKVATKAAESHADSVAKYTTDVEKVASGNAAADADFKTKISRLNEDYDAKIAEAKTRHAADVGAQERSIADLQSQHAEKAAAARSEWAQRAMEAKQATREQARVAGRKEGLQSAQKSYAGMIIDNVKKTHDIVRSKLNGRWNELRDRIGKDAPVEVVHKDSGIPDAGTKDITGAVAKRPSSIFDSINESRAMLAGVPEDLKIFNDLMKQITEGDESVSKSSKDTDPVIKESIPFDKARTQYSAIGDKAFGADGNMRRALFNVYEAYDRALAKTAETAGQGKVYSALKKDWAQFRNDWDNTSATIKGGSPLAKLRHINEMDAKTIADQILSKSTGDRLFATFARYTQDGAVPRTMAKLRNTAREMASLPTVKAPKAIGDRATLPEAPKIPESVSPVEPKLADIEAERTKKIQRATEDRPQPKPAPIPPQPPTIEGVTKELEKAKAERVKEFGAGQARVRTYDLIAGIELASSTIGGHSPWYPAAYLGARVGWGVLANSEFMGRWLSKVTPADIKAMTEALDKTGERAEASKAITDGLMNKARKGEPLPPLNTFSGLLTRAQLGSILRMVAPPQGQQGQQGRQQPSSEQSAASTAAQQ